MEVLLNLFWLLVALSAFACWKPRIMPAARRGFRRRQGLSPLLALTCALAVFFPAISVTDDLHPAVFVADDSSSVRRSAIAVSGSRCQSNQGTLSFPPALLAALFQLHAPHFVLGMVEFPVSSHPATPLTRAEFGRAPPKL